MTRWRLLSGLAGLAILATTPVVGARQFDAHAFLTELVELGSREAGAPGYRQGQVLILRTIESLGLSSPVRSAGIGAGGWTHLEGHLGGRSERELVLSAHYDSLAGEPGALDNASGCAVVLGAAERLAEVPRLHTVRVMLTDAEESGALGTREWLVERTLQERRRMLANLNLDMVGLAPLDRVGVIHLVAGSQEGRRVITPAWLIHALLQGAAAADFEVAILDPNWSWLAQLAVRVALPTRLSDGRRFQESGVPSVTLSDIPMTLPRSALPGPREEVEQIEAERLESWIRLVTAAVRRLDSLEDRPVHESEYLVLGGRVWIRRDLVWVGFVLWILLVWRGLPGSWRSRDTAGRRRMGRGYLPAFAFRMLFLLAVFLIPTFAAILLYPVGLLALVGRPESRSRRQAACLLAAVPTLSFLIFIAVGQLAGWFVFDGAALLPATLVLFTLATFSIWQLDTAPVGGEQ